jgi:ribosomal protein S24E
VSPRARNIDGDELLGEREIVMTLRFQNAERPVRDAMQRALLALQNHDREEFMAAIISASFNFNQLGLLAAGHSKYWESPIGS